MLNASLFLELEVEMHESSFKSVVVSRPITFDVLSSICLFRLIPSFIKEVV